MVKNKTKHFIRTKRTKRTKQSKKSKSENSARITVPLSVKRQAELALKLIEKGFQGCTDIGRTRAKQLARAKFISEKDYKSIASFVARHKVTSRPGWVNWKNAGQPLDDKVWYSKRSILSWQAWGGDAAMKWVEKDK